MSADGIFVIGASGHAKVVIDIVERQSLWRIVGLIDTYKSPGTEVMGYGVLGCESCLPDLMAKHGVGAAIVAIGDNRIRHQVALRVAPVAPSLAFVNAVHPSARIARDVETVSYTHLDVYKRQGFPPGGHGLPAEARGQGAPGGDYRSRAAVGPRKRKEDAGNLRFAAGLSAAAPHQAADPERQPQLHRGRAGCDLRHHCLLYTSRCV